MFGVLRASVGASDSFGMSENCFGILSDMLSSCQIWVPGNKYLGLFLVKDTPENILLCGTT